MSSTTLSEPAVIVPVPLQHPVKRGETEISSVSLRKPKAGELRGLTLQALGQSDVASLITLIPRISDPSLTQPEVEALEVVDLTAIGSVVFDFFLTADQRSKISEMLGS